MKKHEPASDETGKLTGDRRRASQPASQLDFASVPDTPGIGILMLDTQFPRIAGDAGNPITWPFPVHYRVVPGAKAAKIVSARQHYAVEPFIEQALELQAMNVAAITTSCGFLSLHQAEISAALSVPFLASSLLQIPLLNSLLGPRKRAGILTIDAQSLGQAHLQAIGVPLDTPIYGTEGGREFTRAILSDSTKLDVEQCRIDNVEAARKLCCNHPEVGCIVLECTNMAPYASDIQNATGLPVYSIYSFVCWLHAGLMPRTFLPAHPIPATSV